MSNKITQLEVEIDAEEAARLRQLFESNDEKAVAAELERLSKAALVHEHARELRIRLLTDVVRSAYYLLRQDDKTAAEALLAATNELLEGRPLTMEVLASVFETINGVMARLDCEGQA